MGEKTNKGLIENFLLDSDVQLAMDWEKSQNIFDILEINETWHSKMLAWLLNPREGHLQGDYFIKALLRAGLRNKGEVQKIPALDFPIDNFSFINAIVITELECKGRIDIAILDPDSEIAVFIENKTGSSESGSQTEKYREFLFDKYDNSYRCFFIFMDMEEKAAKDKDWWFNVSYSWLTEAIRCLLDRNVLTDNIKHTLLDYRSHIDELENEREYFKSSYELLPQVAHTHRELISKVKNIEPCKPSEIFSCYEETTDSEKYLRYFYLKHKVIFDSLCDYTKLEILEKELGKELSSKYSIEMSRRGSMLLLSPKGISDCAKDKNEVTYYFKIEKHRYQDNKGDSEVEICFRVWCFNLTEEYQDKFKKKYGKLYEYKTITKKEIFDKNDEDFLSALSKYMEKSIKSNQDLPPLQHIKT